MKRLALAALFVAAVALADTDFRVDNVKVGNVSALNLVKDGGLWGQRDGGVVAMLECAVAGTTTRGCVEPADQSWTGPKRIAGGTQDVCVVHASLTACNAGNAGLHQCCSTHSNAEVWCNGASNVELSGSSSYTQFPPIYVNGLLGSHLFYLSAWTLPFAYTITSVSGFIAPGVGTTQTLRFTDTVNNCDCSIDCTTGNISACSGNCTYAASTVVIPFITSDGCTTPTTVKGLLVPAGYRL